MATVIGDERNQHRTGVRLKDRQMFRQVSTQYGQSVRFHRVQTFVDFHGIEQTSAKYYLSVLLNKSCLMMCIVGCQIHTCSCTRARNFRNEERRSCPQVLGFSKHTAFFRSTSHRSVSFQFSQAVLSFRRKLSREKRKRCRNFIES